MKKSEHLLSLDALRGVAALLIVLHHYVAYFGDSISTSLNGYFYQTLQILSNFNVQVVHFFFILSGFCIALSLKQDNLSNWFSIKKYFASRSRRILPLYLVSLVFSLAVHFLIHRDQFNRELFFELIGNLLFLQTSKNIGSYWFAPLAGNGPLWSLSYEVFYYCLLPFVFYVKRRYLARVNYVICFMILFVLGVGSMVLAKKLFTPWFQFAALFPLWFLGFFSGYTYLRSKHCYLFYSSMLFVSSIVMYLANRYANNYLFYLFVAVCIAVVFHFYTHLTQLQIYGPLLNICKVFAFAGTGSYAIYVLHYPVILALVHYEVSPVMSLVSIILFLLICIFLDRFIQEYFKNRRVNLSVSGLNQSTVQN